MNIYLRKLSLNDGVKELEYIRTVPEEENGFYNPADEEDMIDEKSFKRWVINKLNDEKSINLKEGYVPQTIYWVMKDNNIIGIGKIRHYLNKNLLEHGGLIGLAISKYCRDKGIGTNTLNMLLDKASNDYGIKDVLLTNNEDNMASRRIVEKCGGQLEKIRNGTCYYWIKLKN